MSSIKKRPNGKWRARYRDADKQEHSRHFDRKTDAQRWLDEVTTSIVTGQYVHPKAGDITFYDYAETWRTIASHRESSADLVRRHFTNHVYPAIGQKRLKNITPSDIRSLDKTLGEKLAPATVVVIHRYVSAVLASAVRDRKIPVSPTVTVTAPKPGKKKVVPLSTEVVFSLRDVVPDRYRALVVTTAGTGLRQGEVFGLTLDRVDLMRRTMTVDRQLVSVNGARPAFGELKTEASEREIPLPQTVVDAIAAHLATYPTGADGLIFTNSEGGALRRSGFNEIWTAARRTVLAAFAWLDASPEDRVGSVAKALGTSTAKAGALVVQARAAGLVPPDDASPTLIESARAALGDLPRGAMVFHDLRHYYASLLIRRGASVKVVQARLGHKSAAETLDTYSHLWPDDDDRTRDAVDSVLGAVLADSLRTAPPVAA
ncbi:tyrosine-type recombinase/integrase [Promicromonospora iranensis]|uniref:tyrosine-type recombinase/integrase n=1 Tax=Promicromonospora iranensis TaxID=1105144 RepID=UPI003157F66F